MVTQAIIVLSCKWRQLGSHYGMQGAYQSSIQSDKYQVSHRCSCFSWWWSRVARSM